MKYAAENVTNKYNHKEKWSRDHVTYHMKILHSRYYLSVAEIKE